MNSNGIRKATSVSDGSSLTAPDTGGRVVADRSLGGSGRSIRSVQEGGDRRNRLEMADGSRYRGADESDFSDPQAYILMRREFATDTHDFRGATHGAGSGAGEARQVDIYGEPATDGGQGYVGKPA
jgi:hypothetical protein